MNISSSHNSSLNPMTNVSSFHKLHMFLAFYEFALKLFVTWSRSEWLDPQTRWAMLKWRHRFFGFEPFERSRVFVARCRTEVNVFSARENRFSSCFRTSIGSSYVGTDGPARTVDETQIYLYSCANSPLLQEERMRYGRPERRAKRCVGVRTICECHCATQSRCWTWRTEELWNTRLNTSLVHALSRSAPNSPAILIVTWGIERLEYMSIHSGAKKKLSSRDNWTRRGWYIRK